MFKIGVRMAPVMILPWMFDSTHCFFWNKGPKIEKNKI